MTNVTGLRTSASGPSSEATDVRPARTADRQLATQSAPKLRRSQICRVWTNKVDDPMVVDLDLFLTPWSFLIRLQSGMSRDLLLSSPPPLGTIKQPEHHFVTISAAFIPYL